MWWECDDCVFATNSSKTAIEHIHETGHTCTPEKDEDNVPE